MLRLVLAAALMATPVLARSAPPSAATGGHARLVDLFGDWRAFNQPAMRNGVPDYSAAAMARKQRDFGVYRTRLKALDTGGWDIADKGDYRLVEAEMNGLDFNFRVLKPWARDPGFYLTVFPDMSDVPAHEGTYAEPVIDLFPYQWPLKPADDAKLAAQLETVAPLLDQARVNLAGSRAHDLWSYGAQGFLDQAEALEPV